MARLCWVGAGSALGGLARFGLETLSGGSFAVFAANAIGAFGIGFYAVLSGPGGALNAGPSQRLFVMPGLLAGLTSFSMFSLHAEAMLRASPTASAIFVLASIASWIVGVGSGDALASALSREPDNRARDG